MKSFLLRVAIVTFLAFTTEASACPLWIGTYYSSDPRESIVVDCDNQDIVLTDILFGKVSGSYRYLCDESTRICVDEQDSRFTIKILNRKNFSSPNGTVFSFHH
jgi:hypothetical protein